MKWPWEMRVEGLSDENRALIFSVGTDGFAHALINKVSNRALEALLNAARKAGFQAREDAQPVGWLRAVDEEMVCAHLGVADAEDSFETAKKKLASLIQWNIAVATDPRVGGHLAPDALRVAVEALRKADEAARRGASMVDADYNVRADRLGEEIYAITSKALAALQAEQGAK